MTTTHWHCPTPSVIFRGGRPRSVPRPAGYTIRNVGSANPIVIRGQPLGRGESTALSHRDQVRIGGYLLEVIDEEDGTEASTITRGRASVEASVPTPPRISPPTPRGGAASADLGGPFADLALPASSDDPFADLLGPGATPSPAVPLRPDATPAPQRVDPLAAEKDPFAELLPPAAGVAASSPAWGQASAFAGDAKAARRLRSVRAATALARHGPSRRQRWWCLR